MVSKDNKTFHAVYDKFNKELARKVKIYFNSRKYGKKLNPHELKYMYLVLNYLKSINESHYEYFKVKGLTEISNKLNSIK